jgi:hypothetical protein
MFVYTVIKVTASGFMVQKLKRPGSGYWAMFNLKCFGSAFLSVDCGERKCHLRASQENLRRAGK